MDHMRALGLLDSNGKPLGDRIERVLAGLLPKLRRRFPNLQDEVAITEVMEEAGRRIANREERGGPIERLHGYAWVTVRSVATVTHATPADAAHSAARWHPEASQEHIALAPAQYGSPEQIERDILLREVLAEALAGGADRLPVEDGRLLCPGDCDSSGPLSGFRRYTILASQAEDSWRCQHQSAARTTRQLAPPTRRHSTTGDGDH